LIAAKSEDSFGIRIEVTTQVARFIVQGSRLKTVCFLFYFTF